MFKSTDPISTKPGRKDDDPTPEEMEARVRKIAEVSPNVKIKHGTPHLHVPYENLGRPQKRLTYEEHISFCADWKAGLKFKVLQHKYSITEYLVKKFAKEYGLKPRRKKNGRG